MLRKLSMTVFGNSTLRPILLFLFFALLCAFAAVFQFEKFYFHRLDSSTLVVRNKNTPVATRKNTTCAESKIPLQKSAYRAYTAWFTSLRPKSGNAVQAPTSHGKIVI